VTKQRGASIAWDTSHSRPHRKIENNQYNVYDGFVSAAAQIAKLKDEAAIRGRARVREGDARNLSFVRQGSVGAIITSPPYLNAIDYMRGHRLALVWLGFDLPALRRVRRLAIGAERGAEADLDLNYARSVVSKSVSGFHGLPLRWQSIVLRFVGDTLRFLQSAHRTLRLEAPLCLITGDSNVRGAQVQTAGIYKRCALDAGFRLKKVYTRALDSRKRYLPIDSGSSALSARMRTETVQIFLRA
jgi:hypothetical protein